MTSRRRSARLCLEPLAGRVVPANLTVTFAAGTLTVVGDADANDVTVEANPADPTHFTLTSTTDTFNNQPSPFSSPAGVKNLVFKMLDGNDSVTFGDPVTVEGNVSVDGGDGTNTVAATTLTVARNLAVTNGTATAGAIQTHLTDLSVGGNVTVKSAGGDTDTTIQRDSVGVSTIRGGVKVTNGIGADTFVLTDTNVNGSVTVGNGHGGAGGIAGQCQINNFHNTAFRSVIGGNLTVSYLDGNGNNYLLDSEVLGNVTLNQGPGAFTTHIDGYLTQLPVLVHGSVSVLGTGADAVDVGHFQNATGLVVGKKFTLTSGGGSVETVEIDKLRVGGDTSLTLNDGGNTVLIDDSEFAGTFTLASGAGNDTVGLETAAGTSSATVFKKAVLIDLGAGTDTFDEVYTGSNTIDNGEALVYWGTVTVQNAEVRTAAPGNIFYPNGQ